MTTSTLRKLLGISSDTTWRWVRLGILPRPEYSYKGRRLGWDRWEVERFVQRCRRQDASLYAILSHLGRQGRSPSALQRLFDDPPTEADVFFADVNGSREVNMLRISPRDAAGCFCSGSSTTKL
jgi:predicted DNA-binding transcriptional regulator AlpA